MVNVINYMYIATNTGFIINSAMLLVTIGVVWKSIGEYIPEMNLKLYLSISGIILLLLLVAKVLFILFVDKERFIYDDCITLYCDAVNTKFAVTVLVINATVLFFKYLYHSFSFNIFEDFGVILCFITLIISALIWWHYFHFSTPPLCRVYDIPALNSFWSQ